MKFKVTTKLRDGIKDIEGETIEQKLNQDLVPEAKKALNEIKAKRIDLNN